MDEARRIKEDTQGNSNGTNRVSFAEALSNMLRIISADIFRRFFRPQRQWLLLGIYKETKRDIGQKETEEGN